MKLPNCDTAYVPDAKLFEYLLSPSHPEGGPKASFFEAVGYTAENGESLRMELIRIAKDGTMTEETSIDCGQKYVVEGTLSRSIADVAVGHGIPLRTISVIDKDSTAPRFVTAYPL